MNSKKIIFDTANEKLMNYMKVKYGWTDDVVDDIEWDSWKNAFGTYKSGQQMTMAKLVHQWVNTGEQRKCIDPLDDNKCPYCKETEEYTHVFECQHKNMVTKWKTINECLTAMETSPLIKKYIKSLYHNIPIATINPCDEHEHTICTAITMQQKIGKTSLRCGRLSKYWEKAQYTYESMKQIPHANWNQQCALLLQEHSLEIWKARNETLHCNEQNPTKSSAPTGPTKLHKTNEHKRVPQEPNWEIWSTNRVNKYIYEQSSYIYLFTRLGTHSHIVSILCFFSSPTIGNPYLTYGDGHKQIIFFYPVWVPIGSFFHTSVQYRGFSAASTDYMEPNREVFNSSSRFGQYVIKKPKWGWFYLYIYRFGTKTSRFGH